MAQEQRGTKTVDLRGIPRIVLDSVTVKETDANDTLDAAARCIPAGGGEISQTTFGLMLRQQILAGSVVSYTRRNGASKELKGQPCLEMENWTTRTREFVGEVYDHVNGVAQEERDAFRKALAAGELSEQAAI